METIKFNENYYPTMLIKMPFGLRKISTEALNEKLMNFDGSYVSEKARIIDEEIFYFVPEESITLANDEMVNLILSEL